ncbi:oligosaccharide flippase family protein [Paenochrobactrum sp. BZR 588]|uniref:oligosaccharide flippase family protein n=1 Tax=Paenochrobactrum TaxID=999488 RepID=UPI0035BC085E
MEQYPSGKAKRTTRPLGQMLLSYAASSGSLLAANIAQLMTFAILARSLGSEQFGLLVTILAITAIATHICGLGSTESLVRRVAQNKQVYTVLFGHCLSLIALTGAALVLLGMSVLPLWIELTTQGNFSEFSILLLLITNIVLVRLILLVEQIYIAHGQYQSANLSVVGFAFARMFTAAVACLVFTTQDLFTWAVWQFACHVIVMIFYYYFIWRLGKPVYRIIRHEIRLGLLFASQFVFKTARQNVDLLMLSTLMPAGFVGSYAIVRRIIDSSTMGIEAMNRLAYPRLAAASTKGIQNAYAMTKKLQMAALGIGFFTSLSIFIFAPILPFLFGSDYDTLVQYSRILCWTNVFFALWAVPIETLGAAGRHGYRSAILNSANIFGGALLALATWAYPPQGTFAAFYVIDLALAIASWWCLLKTVRQS